VLLPALEARGERVTIACGTSVGAINASVLASLAHLPAAKIGEAIVERWRSLRKSDVFARIVGPASVRNALRLGADALGLPGLRGGACSTRRRCGAASTAGSTGRICGAT